MSDEEASMGSSDCHYLATEYKDGQLQIIEVTPFDKNDGENQILPHLTSTEDQPKYMEILNPSTKGLVQLDMLNLTLVRCPGDEESYQLVANTEASEATDIQSETVTCVLQSTETEEHDSQDGSYVMLDSESSQDSMVVLKSANHEESAPKKTETKSALTPAELIERAKAIQKAKTAKVVQQTLPTSRPRGRRRKNDLPPPHELLASPNFKLYLYSCKICPYKCNAIKDMWAHRAAEHSGMSRRVNTGRGNAATLQCARCPFRGQTHTQLMKHVQEKHVDSVTNVIKFSDTVKLSSEEVEAADVLVCGACGFESASRPLFRKHIEVEHGATTC